MTALTDEIRGSLQTLAASMSLRDAVSVRGSVAHVADGVAHIVGLAGVGFEELVRFDNGAVGMIFDIRRHAMSAVLLSGHSGGIHSGTGVKRLNRLPALPVGRSLLGRVVDPLGNPLDDDGGVPEAMEPVFRSAPSLTERAPVQRPLFTGVMAIDTAVPIGRGQRQLIIGDRNVGKSALALDIISAQSNGDVVCVYVAIGQPMSRVLAQRSALQSIGALANTVVVAANASESPGMQYLAPYAGASVADWFCRQGQDALIVYDDLTKHADAYRELALLVGRPPGREAFPGDIFYLHGELLERSAALSANAGGGSVTALPIVETTDGDLSSYIPTNLISITDGQVYLDTANFERGNRPAVDIGQSVSRIGSAAQPDLLRKTASNFRISMSRFEELEALTRVGLDVDAKVQRAVHRGRLMRDALKQLRFAPRTVAEQSLALTCIQSGSLDAIEPPLPKDRFWRAVTEVASSLSTDAEQWGEAYQERQHAKIRKALEEVGS